ncbi:beta-ketoacyl-[acyl-carrier-protein] synthase family protein [Streptomyces sp. NPDC051555]|uniref:beta-ketoacyl-[acyl-carrier-protein] synthase family protein n=1 Tax=Streptomyces sp. NPDC051555 TaxID=3365657 RepID=UPI003793FC20
MRGRRVVVTGVGIKTAAGNDVDTLWKNLLAGTTTARRLPAEKGWAPDADTGCLVPAFDTDPYASARDALRMDRCSLLGLSAATDAVLDAGGMRVAPERRAVVVGTAHGGAQSQEQAHAARPDRVAGAPKALHIPLSMFNASAAWISMKHDIKGPSLCVTTACASGTQAVGEAFRMVKYGIADTALAGGNEAAITPLNLLAYLRSGSLSPSGEGIERTPCPFDRRRNGFVMGEGAAFLMLEEMEQATARGARILCEVTGYGCTSDAFHISAPEGSGQGPLRAMSQALAEAGLAAADVVHVNAHGTGTRKNDEVESRSLADMFGDFRIPVTSTKGTTGHLMGAAGALEAAIAALSVERCLIPPTAHFSRPDDDCRIDVVHDTPRQLAPGAVLSNFYGFGGHNAAICLVPYPHATAPKSQRAA